MRRGSDGVKLCCVIVDNMLLVLCSGRCTVFLVFFFFFLFFVFFFNDTATTEIYTLSLHDALPILLQVGLFRGISVAGGLQRILKMTSLDHGKECQHQIGRAHV